MVGDCYNGPMISFANFIRRLVKDQSQLLFIGLFASFALESFYFAFTTLPNFDEQLYLFKGYQLAIGATHFLEPFSYWWNKMVGSFAFWGWVQLVAGKGLFAPRLAIAFLNIGAGWFMQDIAKRSLKSSARLILIILMVLTFPMVSNWSVANSQVLINFLLVLYLWILSKPNLSLISIIGLAVVSAAMVLTRENMIFIIPPTIIYLFFRVGFKRTLAWLGLVSTIGGLWFVRNYPNDILLLTRFVPSIVLPDFNLYQAFTLEQNAVEAFELVKTLRAISYTLRMAPIHYWGAVTGSFTVLFAIRKTKPENCHYFAYLALLFWFLFLPHVWVTQSLGYCAYCLATYSGFFISIGALLFVFSLENAEFIGPKNGRLSEKVALWLFAILYFLVPMISRSMASIAEDTGWNRGLIWLAQALTNKFQFTPSEFRQVWLVFFAIVVGTFAFILFEFSVNFIRRIYPDIRVGVNSLLVFIFVISSLSSLFIGKNVAKCRANVVDWARLTSSEITRSLPNEPTIYLNGEWAALPLLYLNQPYEVFKPQLNSNFSYSAEIADERVQRFGLWNELLARKWRSEANVFLFDRPEYEKFVNLFEVHQFRTYNYAYAPNNCPTQIDLYVLIRKE